MLRAAAFTCASGLRVAPHGPARCLGRISEQQQGRVALGQTTLLLPIYHFFGHQQIQIKVRQQSDPSTQNSISRVLTAETFLWCREYEQDGDGPIAEFSDSVGRRVKRQLADAAHGMVPYMARCTKNRKQHPSRWSSPNQLRASCPLGVLLVQVWIPSLTYIWVTQYAITQLCFAELLESAVVGLI
jgi:hypothetical protein